MGIRPKQGELMLGLDSVELGTRLAMWNFSSPAAHLKHKQLRVRLTSSCEGTTLRILMQTGPERLPMWKWKMLCETEDNDK